MGQRRRTHLAKTFDVERAATSDMLDPPAHLGRAASRVWAAQVYVALFGRGEQGVALWAVRRHHKFALGAVAQLNDRPEHLGNHVAGLAQHDRVTDQHAFGLHDILVVKGGLTHHRAGHSHRLHHGKGSDPASATHADDNVEQLRIHLLWRVLVGDRPARGPAGGTELIVEFQLVDLDHDAVDLVLDGFPRGTSAVCSVIRDEFRRIRRRLLHLEMSARRKAPALHQPVDLGLRGDRWIRPRTDAVHEHAQSPESLVHALELARRLALCHLAQAPGCRVASIREHPVARCHLVSIELRKDIRLEKDLTAHLDDRRMPGARQSVRDARHEGDVLGDIFADHPVTPRRRGDEDSVFIAKVDREAVDLELAEVIDAAGRVALHLRGPFGEFAQREDVIEAEHPLRVPHRGEQGGLGAPPDGLRRRVLAVQLGEQPLEFLQPVQHPIVFFIGDEHLVALVVRIAQFEDAHRELPGRLAGLLEGEVFCAVFVLVRHSLSLGSTPENRPPLAASDRSAGGSRNGGYGAVDRALAKHPGTEVDHGRLAGGDAVERNLRTDDEFAIPHDGDSGNGIGMRPNLHVALEFGVRIGWRAAGPTEL